MKRALSTLETVKQTTGNIVWMSLEPLSWDMAYLFKDHPLDWVVIGAASNGPKYFQPDPAHVANLLPAFASTPVFYKGNIKACIEGNGLGRWREDFPAFYRDGSPIAAVQQRQDNAIEYGWARNAYLDDALMPVKQLSFLA